MSQGLYYTHTVSVCEQFILIVMGIKMELFIPKPEIELVLDSNSGVHSS